MERFQGKGLAREGRAPARPHPYRTDGMHPAPAANFAKRRRRIKRTGCWPCRTCRSCRACTIYMFYTLYMAIISPIRSTDIATGETTGRKTGGKCRRSPPILTWVLSHSWGLITISPQKLGSVIPHGSSRRNGQFFSICQTWQGKLGKSTFLNISPASRYRPALSTFSCSVPALTR